MSSSDLVIETSETQTLWRSDRTRIYLVEDWDMDTDPWPDQTRAKSLTRDPTCFCVWCVCSMAACWCTALHMRTTWESYSSTTLRAQHLSFSSTIPNWASLTTGRGTFTFTFTFTLSWFIASSWGRVTFDTVRKGLPHSPSLLLY